MGALVTRTHGSPKTQNIQDAVTHAQSSEPLARRATEQVSPMRKYGPVPRRLPILRLLPRAAGLDARKQIAVVIALSAMPNVEYCHDASPGSGFNFHFAFGN
jgi:hypothetical protein